MELTGRSALVTGGASGLGAAAAAVLARRGAHVTALDLPQALELIPASPGITYVAADVTDDGDVRGAVRSAQQHGPLQLVVNCAGIAPSARIFGRSGVHDLAQFARVVHINLVGTFTVMAIASEAMATAEPDRDGQRGVIINTASISAFDGQVGQAAYAASKGGVVALTLPAARDLAQYGIRVCTIAPGIVDTPMMAGFSVATRENLAAGVPFPKRLCRPEEFGQLVEMIIRHDYLNGETIRMDGSLRMAPR